jgi:hypothetical protein
MRLVREAEYSGRMCTLLRGTVRTRAAQCAKQSCTRCIQRARPSQLRNSACHQSVRRRCPVRTIACAALPSETSALCHLRISIAAANCASPCIAVPHSGTWATYLCMLARAASRTVSPPLRAATFHRLLARKREREAKIIRRTSSRRASDAVVPAVSESPLSAPSEATPHLPAGTSALAVSVTIEGSAPIAQSAHRDSSEMSIATPAASEAYLSC